MNGGKRRARLEADIRHACAITAIAGAGIVVFSIANVTGRSFAGNILNGGTISSNPGTSMSTYGACAERSFSRCSNPLPPDLPLPRHGYSCGAFQVPEVGYFRWP